MNLRSVLRRVAWGVVLTAGVARAEPPPEPPPAPALPPSPWSVLGSQTLRTPVIDVVPFCVPAELGEDLEGIARGAAVGQGAAALEALATTPAAKASPRAAALLGASIQARSATDTRQRQSAHGALRDALLGGGPESCLACGRLELARLELLLGRNPEAAASAVQAGRLRARIPNGAFAGEAADFLRAEAHYRSGADREAGSLFRLLAQSESARIAAAARLRLADLRFDAGEPAAARPEYEALLPRAASFGASPQGWSPRAAEAALADADPAGAEAWLRRFLALEPAPDPARAALARIRLADVLAQDGRIEESREALEQVADARRGKPAAVLANVRTVDLRLSRADAEAQLAELGRAAQSPERGLALYARGVLARRLVELRRVDEALDVLARLAYDAASLEIAPHFPENLDAALAIAASEARSDADCATLVRRLGERRQLLARHASSPDPFLRLGECYTALGFPGSALAVYRALARSFGAQLGSRISLPVGEAALAAGDVAVARAAAEAGASREEPDAAQWRLLLAQVELIDGRWEQAAKLAAEVVRSGEPRAAQVRAIGVLARAAVRLPDSEAQGALLEEALGKLSVEERKGVGPQLGETLLLTAEIRRQSAHLESAREHYAQAVETLAPGPLRAQAAYWLGALHPDPMEARSAWEIAARTPGGGAWSRLAESELRTAPLRDALGRDAPPPAARP